MWYCFYEMSLDEAAKYMSEKGYDEFYSDAVLYCYYGGGYGTKGIKEAMSKYKFKN